MKKRSLTHYVVVYAAHGFDCDEDCRRHDHTLVLRGPVGREVAICREIGVGKRQITRHATPPAAKSSGHHPAEVRDGLDRLSTRGFREVRN